MSTLDAAIDHLYHLPLGEFTAARNALARTLTGPDKAQVQALSKPTLVPWAVNQLYWSARPAYEKAMKSGAALRTAQISALEGRPAPVAKATEAHREAVRDAATRALALSAKQDQHPQAEPLTRMIEALSLSAEPPDHPGRFVEIVQPSGFEALAGLDPLRLALPRAPQAASATPARDDKTSARAAADDAAAERRRAETAVAAAEAALGRLELQATRAAQVLTAAQARVEEAEETLTRANASVAEARQDLTRAQDALARFPAPPSHKR